MHTPSTDGSYRTLVSFQLATIIYDRTVAFCERFVNTKSRLIDQMVQAARSGRQNIAEGSRTGLVNPESARRLTAVARASLEELLLDFEDYLRQRGLPQWDHTQGEATLVLNVWSQNANAPAVLEATAKANWRQLDEIHASWYANWFSPGTPAAVQANALICLIHQANYRLDRMLAGRARRNGGTSPGVTCAVCGSPMVIRTIRDGERKGQQFLGCSRYPACKSTAAIR